MRKIVLYFLLVLLLFNCGTNPNEGISDDSKIGELAMYKVMSNQSQNALNYEISNEQFVLRLYSDIDGSTYKSKIEVLHVVEDSVKLFELDYAFNTSESHWKIRQKDNVLSLSSQMEQKNLSLATLKNLSEFLKESVPVVYYELIEPNNKDQVLFSSIHYYESAINTLIRSKENNTDINGTIHPGYLLGKNYFVFQEDDIVDLSIFNIAELAESSTILADKKLVQFIAANSAQKVPFSALYSFYNENEQFEEFLTNNMQVQTNGCNSNSCWIGCGGDIGCCGNYSGCCVYSSTLCLIHDVRCKNCSYWHCGPSCKPTTPGTKTVKFLIG